MLRHNMEVEKYWDMDILILKILQDHKNFQMNIKQCNFKQEKMQ